MRVPLLVYVAAVVLAASAFWPRHHKQHPCTHGESSIAGRLVGKGKHRHFVVTQPPAATGCVR